MTAEHARHVIEIIEARTRPPRPARPRAPDELRVPTEVRMSISHPSRLVMREPRRPGGGRRAEALGRRRVRSRERRDLRLERADPADAFHDAAGAGSPIPSRTGPTWEPTRSTTCSAARLVLANPETGEVHVVEAGEAIAFGRDTWHHGFSQGDGMLDVLQYFAPAVDRLVAALCEDPALPRSCDLRDRRVARAMARWTGRGGGEPHDAGAADLRRHVAHGG